MKFAVNKKNPADLLTKGDSPRIDSMDEATVCNSIPISKFKSSHLSRKKNNGLSIDASVRGTAGGDDQLQLSPSATQAFRDNNFKNIDHPSLLSQVTSGVSKMQIDKPAAI